MTQKTEEAEINKIDTSKKPPLDFDMLVEMKEYLMEIRDELIVPEKNILVEMRILFKKQHRIAELERVKDKIDRYDELYNKNHNFIRFLKHYLNTKKGAKPNELG